MGLPLATGRTAAPKVADHRPLLDAAGFDVLAYEETMDWRRRQLATTDGMLAALDEMAAQTGEDPVELGADLREMRANIAAIAARRLIVAELRDRS